jgi:hypothetical protein
MAAEPQVRLHEYFVSDLPVELAGLMARSQVINAANNFKTVITTPCVEEQTELDASSEER